METGTPKFNLRKSIHQQICAMIQQKLETGGPLQLPAEAELAVRFQVSRATIREVLSELAGEGYILRRHGCGTFINPSLSQRKTPMTPMPYFLDIIASYGHKPRIEFIDYALVKEPPEAAARLRLPPGREMARLTLAYYAGEQVCIVCYDYFDAALMKKEAFTPMAQCSIFQILYQEAGCTVTWANTLVNVTDTWQAPAVGRLMDIPPEKVKPLLLVKNICYDTKDAPVLYSESFFDTALIEFSYIQQYGQGRKMDDYVEYGE